MRPLAMNDFFNSQKYDGPFAFICGTVGWILHTTHFTLLQINIPNALLALAMAFLSGAAGVLGKHCITAFLAWYKKKSIKDGKDKSIIYKKK